MITIEIKDPKETTTSIRKRSLKTRDCINSTNTDTTYSASLTEALRLMMRAGTL